MFDITRGYHRVTFDGNGDIDQPEDDDLRSYLFGPSGDDDAPEKNRHVWG